MPTYANTHLPEWPIFGSLWPPTVSHYGQLHKKGDIRQVFVNKHLGGRDGQTYIQLSHLKSAFRTNDRGIRKENGSPLFGLLTIVKNLDYWVVYTLN